MIDKYPPPIMVEETDFRNAYAKLVRHCMRDGLMIVANSKSSNPVMTRDINSFVTLSGNAIQQIWDHTLHPYFPTKGKHLEEYIKTLTREYMWEHMKLPEEKQFKYLYIQRLALYRQGLVDELGRLYDKLREDGINRQTQIITWDPEIDFPVETPKGHDPPCLQRIWIRVLREPVWKPVIDVFPYSDVQQDIVVEKGLVEVHLTWRSRDLYGAWMSNIIAVMEMIKREILKDEYKVVKIVDFCNSLHIYEADWENANNIKLVPIILR